MWQPVAFLETAERHDPDILFKGGDTLPNKV